MNAEYKQSASSYNRNKYIKQGYLRDYVVIPPQESGELPEEYFKWWDLETVREKYQNKPCKPIRVRPRSNHPIINENTKEFLSNWEKQSMIRNEYASAKYKWLKESDHNWHHPSQTVVIGDPHAPLFFEPGSVKSFVQYETNTGWFDIWDRHNLYEDEHLSFDEWLSEYKYGGNTDIMGYSITNTKDEVCLRLSPMWDRDNFTIWLENENEFSKSKGA